MTVEETKKDLLIIGAGPAGLGAAIYAARSALDFIVTEQFIPGGQIVTTEWIENYPGFKGEISGFDLMQEMIGHCNKFNISIKDDIKVNFIEVSGKTKSTGDKLSNTGFVCKSEKEIFFVRSIIIATGASPKRLFVDGENEFIGKGISFCATCDGALYREREVMVIGGGNTAIQEALFLTKFAKKVYIVHRRNELRAVKLLQDRAKSNPLIEFIWDSVVEGFEGSDRLERAIIKNVRSGKKETRKIDGAFLYIGIKPNSELVKGITGLDKDGFIITDQFMQTERKGLFAAGDVRNTPLRQVITAVSDGAIAATYADMYLNGF